MGASSGCLGPEMNLAVVSGVPLCLASARGLSLG